MMAANARIRSASAGVFAAAESFSSAAASVLSRATSFALRCDAST